MKRKTRIDTTRTRSLFQAPEPKTETLKLPMDMEPGVFYPVDGAFWCFTEQVWEDQEVVVEPYDLGTYFTVHQFRVGKNLVGYKFSGERIHNGGIFLTIRLSDEPAVSFRLVCRTRHMVVYEYPNTGAMVVLPQLGDRIREIIMEQ